MNAFLIFKGLLIGLIFSATTVAATVWCMQLGLKQGLGAAWTAAGAVMVGQVLWATLAVVTVGSLSWDASEYMAGARIFCGVVFVYMAIKSARTARLAELPPLEGAKVGPVRLAMATLAVMLSLPMRFFGLVGLMLAAWLTRRPMYPLDAAALLMGVGAGTLVWFGFVGVVSVRLRERVAPEFWARAVWRQARLASVVYAGLAVIVTLPAMVWWVRR